MKSWQILLIVTVFTLATVLGLYAGLRDLGLLYNPELYNNYSIKIYSYAGEVVEEYEGEYQILSSDKNTIKFKDENNQKHEIHYSPATVTITIDQKEE